MGWWRQPVFEMLDAPISLDPDSFSAGEMRYISSLPTAVIRVGSRNRNQCWMWINSTSPYLSVSESQDPPYLYIGQIKIRGVTAMDL